MFSKPNKAAAPAKAEPLAASAADALRRRGPKIASLIAEDLTIEGDVSGDGELHIDGSVRGDVRVGRLTIGETGGVEGAITAEAVECRGRVIGSITAQQVRLYGAAHVEGDITHDQLTVDAGAFFQGRSVKLGRAQAAIAALPDPAAAKTAAE